MVWVNSQKYACEACIKGHRSSSCHHADRPLYEIKKKGRPVSQCAKCRQARQSRRVHAKCTCADAELPEGRKPSSSSSSSSRPPSKKASRFRATDPCLPNGLKDILESAEEPSTDRINPRQRVDTLLNPCTCDDVWSCGCRSKPSTSASAQTSSNSALTTLAHAASQHSPLHLTSSKTFQETVQPDSTSLKASNNLFTASPTSVSLNRASSSSLLLQPLRNIAPRQPIVESEASQNCCCGGDCTCDSCTLHNPPPETVQSTGPADCPPDCTQCVDHRGGVALPTIQQDTSYLDQFFARAAALPPPPVSRGLRLDPTDVRIYPPSLFERKELSNVQENYERNYLFGLVNIPKLECCGGKCSCPEGDCSCGNECGGCCVDEVEEVTPKPSEIATPPKSCCS